MEQTLETETAGYRSMLFWLVIKSAFFTVITFGFYSFWARTRLRRWLWSSVRPDRSPIEYTGNPWEKLEGLFVAAVILSLYVTTVVMGLAFLSLTLTEDLVAGLIGGVLMVIPLYFAARYRSLRYLANHTRWRGIDFCMRSGAFGYAWRGTLFLTITLLSFGLLMPLQTFQMQKFRIDRTFYGSEPFFMTGTFWGLYKAMFPMLVVILGGGGLLVWAVLAQDSTAGVIAPFLVAFGFFPALLYYRVASFRIMANNIVYAGGTEVEVFPSAGRILWIYIAGSFLVSLLIGTFVPMVAIAFFTVVAYIFVGFAPTDLEGVFTSGDFEALLTSGFLTIFIVSILITYAVFQLLYREARHVFITFPIIRHAADTLIIEEVMPFAEVGPADRRYMGDADGLAGFFDFGGGSV